MTEQQNQRDWLTPAELAKRWPISKSTVVRWLNARKLQGKRFGDKWAVHVSAVEAFERDGMPQPVVEKQQGRDAAWENLPEYV
jgi:excisionase family DNA binding protein